MLKPFCWVICVLLTWWSPAASASEPVPGDWILLKALRASEGVPTAVSWVKLTVENRDSRAGVWWRLDVEKADGATFMLRVCSDSPPLCQKDGSLGRVYRYIFQQGSQTPLEYLDKATKLAALPLYGFREALVPTPRSIKNLVGPFYATASYLGQPLTAQGSGNSAVSGEKVTPEQLVLDNDILMGSSRTTKDDGNGPGADKEYRYVPLGTEDYEKLIASGFNLFIGTDKAGGFIRDRAVFFVKTRFTEEDPYPELLYRANYLGPTIYIDEPASRMDASECRTIYDVVNLLTTRNYSYQKAPRSAVDAIVQMIERAGFGVGDWYPRQTQYPVAETYEQTAFYQALGGANGFWQEGRYQLRDARSVLKYSLGSSLPITNQQMLDQSYAWLRGVARCFDIEWGMSIYGQADPDISLEALERAYDQGAHYIHFWTSDHEHHVPFTRQLSLAKGLSDYRAAHPRTDRYKLNNKAEVALAVPEGYVGIGGMMWWSNRFNSQRYNEFGVLYSDVAAEMIYQTVKLGESGALYDCVVDYPEIVSKAKYKKVIRITPEGTVFHAKPRLPRRPTVQARSQQMSKTAVELDRSDRILAGFSSASTLKVDGNLDDWQGAPWSPLDIKTNYSESQRWDGEKDLSAEASLRYTADALYLAVKVTDDARSCPFDGDDIWKNDSVQVGIDPLNNATEAGRYEFDDIEVGLSEVDGKPYAYIWEGRIARAVGEVKGAQSAIASSGDKTIYEIRLPFSLLPPLIPGYPGRCRINVVVNDNDGAMERKGCCSLTSGISDGKYVNRWKTLMFDPSGMTSGIPCVYAYVVPERKSVTKGHPVKFLLKTGSEVSKNLTVRVRLRYGNRLSDASDVIIHSEAGEWDHSISVDTDGLDQSSYYADIAILDRGREVASQSLKFFVF